MQVLTNVKTPGLTYPVYQGNFESFKQMAKISTPRKIMLITDANVAKLYLEPVKLIFKQQSSTIHQFIVPAGEDSKSLEQVTQITQSLAQAEFTRSDLIIALGGGMIGDLAGFVASIYLRGLAWWNLPTTLLSQVDSSVGGKTGINTSFGKNQLGSFYPAQQVFLVTDFLKTLPDNQWQSGYVEIVKMASLKGQADWQRILAVKDLADLKNNIAPLIQQSVHYKAAIVTHDFKESNQRRLLNFGHTYGHVFEQASHYTMTHGQAVAFGILKMIETSQQLDENIDEKMFGQFIQIFQRVGLQVDPPQYEPEKMQQILLHDKKIVTDHLIIIYLKKIGEPIQKGLKLSKINKFFK